MDIQNGAESIPHYAPLHYDSYQRLFHLFYKNKPKTILSLGGGDFQLLLELFLDFGKLRFAFF